MSNQIIINHKSTSSTNANTTKTLFGKQLEQGKQIHNVLYIEDVMTCVARQLFGRESERESKGDLRGLLLRLALVDKSCYKVVSAYVNQLVEYYKKNELLCFQVEDPRKSGINLLLIKHLGEDYLRGLEQAFQNKFVECINNIASSKQMLKKTTKTLDIVLKKSEVDLLVGNIIDRVRKESQDDRKKYLEFMTVTNFITAGLLKVNIGTIERVLIRSLHLLCHTEWRIILDATKKISELTALGFLKGVDAWVINSIIVKGSKLLSHKGCEVVNGTADMLRQIAESDLLIRTSTQIIDAIIIEGQKLLASNTVWFNALSMLLSIDSSYLFLRSINFPMKRTMLKIITEAQVETMHQKLLSKNHFDEKKGIRIIKVLRFLLQHPNDEVKRKCQELLQHVKYHMNRKVICVNNELTPSCPLF